MSAPRPLGWVWSLALAAVVGAGGWVSLVSGPRAALEEAERREQVLQVRYEEAARRAEHLPLYRARAAEFAEASERLAEYLPDAFEPREGVRERMRREAAERGLVLEALEFGAEREQDFFTVRPFRLRLRGDFAALYDFLYERYHASMRAGRLRGFVLRAEPGNADLVLQMDGASYRYLQTSGEGAAGPASRTSRYPGNGAADHGLRGRGADLEEFVRGVQQRVREPVTLDPVPRVRWPARLPRRNLEPTFTGGGAGDIRVGRPSPAGGS